MAITTYKATTTLLEGTAVEADIRGHKARFESKDAQGNTVSAATPTEMLLASLGACQALTARSVADKMRIHLESFQVEIEGDLDPKGYQTDNGIGYQDIRFHIKIQSDASEDKIQRLIEMVEFYCPVGRSLEKKVTVTGRSSLNGGPAKTIVHGK